MRRKSIGPGYMYKTWLLDGMFYHAYLFGPRIDLIWGYEV